jgi:UDPglucose 6-dehydrogenase
MSKKQKISFVGLGKLGLPLATNLAKKGRSVLAIDINSDLIANLKQGHTPWIETGLEKNIKEAGSNIVYSDNYKGVADTDYTIILVNTPSIIEDGSFSNEYVIEVIKQTCNELVNSNSEGHHFILSSTVMPGSIKKIFIPLIEEITGWTLNDEFSFSYIPDFVAIGSVIKHFHEPDFMLVGSSSSDAGMDAFMLYACMLTNVPPTSYVTLEEAELAKVALNAYITTKISFANFLGLVAEKLDNVNVDNVTSAIGQDKRIGGLYFKAGGPYGGTCFPRDTWAFLELAKQVGLDADQMKANEGINNSVIDNIVEQIKPSYKVGLVGLGFKPGTSVTTEGVASMLVSKGRLDGIEIYVHDIYSDSIDNIVKENDSVIPVKDINDLYQNVDTVVFCNGDKVYDTAIIPQVVKVVDPWRIV